jgi:hypothetical protein
MHGVGRTTSCLWTIDECADGRTVPTRGRRLAGTLSHEPGLDRADWMGDKVGKRSSQSARRQGHSHVPHGDEVQHKVRSFQKCTPQAPTTPIFGCSTVLVRFGRFKVHVLVMQPTTHAIGGPCLIACLCCVFAETEKTIGSSN